MKKAQQRLFNLRKKHSTSTDAQSRVSCRAWYGNCSAHNCKALQMVVRSAQRITGGKLPALQDTYTPRCHRKAIKIIKDINHPSHCLFTHDCVAKHASNSIIKFADEKTVVGLITNEEGRRRLKKFGLTPKTLTKIYRCTIESILSGLVRQLLRPQP